MDVQLSPEQLQLQGSVQRVLADEYGSTARQQAAGSERAWSEAAWSRHAELGLLAIAIPSRWGGLDGSAADLLPVMQAFGHALVLEPVLPTLLGATALACASHAPSQDRLLPRVAAGEHRLAFAHEEPGLAPGQVRLRADRRPQGWSLSGRKSAVLQACDAHSLVVTARTEQGVGLFLVDAAASGLVRQDYQLVDQRRASQLALDHVSATLLAEPSSATNTALTRTVALGTAALVAEAAGAMRAALDVTVDYLRTRKQFGRALAEFQALRHRCAEMLVSVETVEAMAHLAAIAVDAPDCADPARDLARAKLLAGRHGRWVGEQAIQLHGGIGMTDEYVVGHYLQRLLVIDLLLGNEDAQLDALARTSPPDSA